MHGHTHTLGPCSEYPHPKQLTRQSTPQSPQPACQHLNLVSANTGERNKMSCRPSKTASVTYPRCSILCSSSCVHSIYCFYCIYILYISTHEIHTMIEYVWQHTRFSLSSPRRWLKNGNPEPSSPVSRRHPSLPRLGFHSVTGIVEEKMRCQKSDTGYHLVN